MWNKFLPYSLLAGGIAITLCYILVFYNIYLYNRAMDTYISFIGPDNTLTVIMLADILPLRSVEISKSSYYFCPSSGGMASLYYLYIGWT